MMYFGICWPVVGSTVTWKRLQTFMQMVVTSCSGHSSHKTNSAGLVLWCLKQRWGTRKEFWIFRYLQFLWTYQEMWGALPPLNKMNLPVFFLHILCFQRLFGQQVFENGKLIAQFLYFILAGLFSGAKQPRFEQVLSLCRFHESYYHVPGSVVKPSGGQPYSLWCIASFTHPKTCVTVLQVVYNSSGSGSRSKDSDLRNGRTVWSLFGVDN